MLSHSLFVLFQALALEFKCPNITTKFAFFVLLFFRIEICACLQKPNLVTRRAMIEGTRPYRGKNFVAPSQSSSPRSETENSSITAEPPEQTNATNLDPEKSQLNRREWFRSLVPAFGNSLVQILRTSNNLRDDLSELKK